MKIEKEDIANPKEVILLPHLECPIDNMISLDPVMCAKCETVFCRDCIDTWKAKSSVCPMRCSPMEIVQVDKSIIKQQIIKIKLKCPNFKLGCPEKVPNAEMSRHEKTCEYRGVKCEKCAVEIAMINLSTHMVDFCPKNKIACVICMNPFSFGAMLNHVETCQPSKMSCEICLGNTHNESSCELRIINCSKCNLPEISIDIAKSSHLCINPKALNENTLNTYLNNINKKYEVICTEMLMKSEKRYKDFIKNISDITNDIAKREGDKLGKLEVIMAKIQEGIERKLVGMRKEKSDGLERIKHEIVCINNQIDDKEKERKVIELNFANKKEILQKEYDLKVLSKRQNIEYLRSMVRKCSVGKENPPQIIDEPTIVEIPIEKQSSASTSLSVSVEASDSK